MANRLRHVADLELKFRVISIMASAGLRGREHLPDERFHELFQLTSEEFPDIFPDACFQEYIDPACCKALDRAQTAFLQGGIDFEIIKGTFYLAVHEATAIHVLRTVGNMFGKKVIRDLDPVVDFYVRNLDEMNHWEVIKCGQ